MTSENEQKMRKENLSLYAWLSIAAAIVTIALKAAAYFYTGSVGLLSDALESLINLAAAIIALMMIRIAAAPPDEEHSFGHDKAEYFASGIEGALIFIAALSIGYAATRRLFAPQPLEQISAGLIVSSVATVVNLVVGIILIRVGKRNHSIVLEADGRHLLTDVWTSVGVVGGVLAVDLTGWLALDPIVALLVAANIVWTGYSLVYRSAHGLMDSAIPPETQQTVVDILDGYVAEKRIGYHALRTRQAGARKFVYVHILVPDEWTVQKGHALCDEIENTILAAVPQSEVFTHLEPLADPSSWNDLELFNRK